ncbi:MAG: CPBP family intramembrane metalloprotease [Clostridiales bacterium]|nr:CPBP family intramembrane metalloprotease [Clostridiales bacterium]
MEKVKTVRKSDVVLWCVFLVFMFARITCTMSYWMLLSAIVTILGVVLLISAKLPSKRLIVLSLVFALAVTFSYLAITDLGGVLLYSLSSGIPTFVCSLAVFSVMEKRDGFELNTNPKIKGIAIGIAAGLILSCINAIMPGDRGETGFTIPKIVVALSPGIFEEIALRAIFMAFCIWYAKGEKMSRFSAFTMYFMMVIPHTVAHGYDPVSTIILAVLFGIPFALLQKKVDLTSAMLSHYLVDAIRFIFLGW